MNSSSLVILIFPITLAVFCKNFYDLLLYTFVTFMGSVIAAIHHNNIDLTGCSLLYNHVKQYARDIKLRHDRCYRVEFYDHDGYLCFDLEGQRVSTNLIMQPPGSENGIKIGLRVFGFKNYDNIAISNLEESGI